MREKAGAIYFKNLNGLRAIAAILVAITHVDLMKKKLGLPVLNKPYLLTLPIGSLSVTFFFVLSGFLISYLLLQEERVNTFINVRNFYCRRILKIWPLYFLLTLIGFTYLIYTRGGNGLGHSLICYLFILPNFAFISNPLCFQSWSIGVEEQFYLVWPLIINKKRILSISLNIIVLFFIVRTVPEIYHLLKYKCPDIFTGISTFITENRFDSMAIGAILAHLQFNKHIRYQLSAVEKFTFYFIFVVFFLISNKLYFGLQHFIFSILFAIFIFIQINNRAQNNFLESKIMNYLGKISYGIYMWHVVAIYISIKIFNILQPAVNYLSYGNTILLYLTSLIITITISAISYKFYEGYFLTLKSTFYKIIKPKNKVENIIYL